MAISLNGKKRIRKTFGRIPEVAPMPNLIEVQRTSYEHFLQMDVRPEERASVGLQEVFKSVFPIRDFSERAQLEFVRYELETPYTERYNRVSYGFDPGAALPAQVPGLPLRGGVLFPAVGGNPRREGNLDSNNFGPRFGFAWQPFSRTAESVMPTVAQFGCSRYVGRTSC